MKKLASLVLVFAITATLLTVMSSCETSNHEDKLLGTWVCSSGGKTIMYTFEKEENGDYTAVCATTYGSSSPSIYMFDEFSASRTVITFRQDGKQTKNNYYFEDGYLYIDGLEFEKFEK